MTKLINKSTLAIIILSATMAGCSSNTKTNNLPINRTYQISGLKEVVANDPSCDATFKSLQTLGQNPISFQFTPSASGSDSFNVSDTNSQLQNHSYTILHQEINGNIVNRVGMGTFLIDNQEVEYIVAVSGDNTQENFRYVYPVIFSSDNGHCYFTGLIGPDANTVNAFKANITSGKVANKTDLSN